MVLEGSRSGKNSAKRMIKIGIKAPQNATSLKEMAIIEAEIPRPVSPKKAHHNPTKSVNKKNNICRNSLRNIRTLIPRKISINPTKNKGNDKKGKADKIIYSSTQIHHSSILSFQPQNQ